MGERLRQWVKSEMGKPSFGTEQYLSFPGSSFSLPSPVMCSDCRQMLWDADALSTLKPFAAAASHRPKQNVYKEVRWAVLNTGARSSGVCLCDPGKRPTPTHRMSHRIKETQQTIVNNQFIQTFIHLLNYMQYLYNSTAIAVCCVTCSPTRCCSTFLPSSKPSTTCTGFTQPKIRSCAIS